MTNADQPRPQKTSALMWPKEWVVERAFWREVSARTLSGVLTIVVLAFPGLIYAGIVGLLTWERVTPILIGIGFFAVVVLLYVIVLWLIRLLGQRQLKKVLAKENPTSGHRFTAEELATYSPRELPTAMAMYSLEAQNDATRAAKWRQILTTGSSIAIPVLSGLAAAFVAGL